MNGWVQGYRRGYADHIPWREQSPGHRALVLAVAAVILAIAAALAWRLLTGGWPGGAWRPGGGLPVPGEPSPVVSSWLLAV